MKYDRPVSTSVIRRLPRYYRFLGELLEKGINRISSKELSTLMKITASQIRQDSKKRGFRLVGAFDEDRKLVGTTLRKSGVMIYHIDTLEDFCREYQPQVAVICVPKEAAAKLADRLIRAGIVGFWNFSSYDFACLHDNITTVNVHLGDSAMTLSYLMNHMDEEGQTNTLR